MAATFRDKADVPRISDAFQEQAISIHARDLSAHGWALASSKALRLLEKLENTGTPLGRYVDGGFYIGVITGCNDAFVIGETVCQQLIAEDARNSELIKPVLRGKNLRKWKAVSAKEYLIVMASSANRVWPWSDAADALEAEQIFAQTYPAIYRHLNSYRERLVVNTNKGKFYWELRSCAYYTEFEKPKILYSELSKSIYACYDTTGAFGLKTTYSIPTRDLSLLAILNSTLFDWYARHKFQSLNDPWTGGRLQFYVQYMEHVPIANRTSMQKAALSQLVERIFVDTEGDEARDLQKKIDTQVYQLYGLTDEEITLIEQTYTDAGMQG